MGKALHEDEKDLTKSVWAELPPPARSTIHVRVDRIAGKKISPDIDILEIERFARPSFKNMVRGYELKLLKRGPGGKGIGKTSFYKGLGQALLLPKHGMEESLLVLGFHTDTSMEIRDLFFRQLSKEKLRLKQILPSWMGLGFHYNGMLQWLKRPQCQFALDEDGKYLRDSLLRGNLGSKPIKTSAVGVVIGYVDETGETKKVPPR